MDINKFLEESKYVDYTSKNIILKSRELFKGVDNGVEKARIAYEFVRDEINHSFDIKNPRAITSKASDVLKYNTGICHAKANLLAALLRTQNIPVGFRFQHITLADDDSMGYCVHCYNAIYVNNQWIEVDARGNTNGIKAEFSLEEPVLAFPIRSQYDEYFWNGIFAMPHLDTMKMLDSAKTIQDVKNNIPDYINELPEIMTKNN